MTAKPSSKSVELQFTRGNLQYDLLLLVHRCVNFKTIQDEESLHRGVTSAFVAIYKRVILDEGKTQRRRFFDKCRVEFLIAERHARLCQY